MVQTRATTEASHLGNMKCFPMVPGISVSPGSDSVRSVLDEVCEPDFKEVSLKKTIGRLG